MQERVVQFFKPNTGCLFEAIKGMTKLTHIGRMVCIDVSNKLFHEYLFVKSVIQKGIVDVNLLNIPVIGNNKSEDDSNGG